MLCLPQVTLGAAAKEFKDLLTVCDIFDKTLLRFTEEREPGLKEALNVR